MKEIYLRAKQRGEIILSLEEDKRTKKPKNIKVRDWQPELEALLKEAKKLRGGSGQPAIYSPAFSLVKASLQLALVGATEPENADKLYKELQKVERILRRVEDTVYRL